MFEICETNPFEHAAQTIPHSESNVIKFLFCSSFLFYFFFLVLTLDSDDDYEVV